MLPKSRCLRSRLRICGANPGGSQTIPRRFDSSCDIDGLELTCKQLFRFKDRKDGALLLAPTHEEEITSLVAASVQSYRDLPLRLYQISECERASYQPKEILIMLQHVNIVMKHVRDRDF